MATSAAVPTANEIDAAGMLPTALPRPALIGACSAMKPPANTVARTTSGVLSIRTSTAGAQPGCRPGKHRRSGVSLGLQPVAAARDVDLERRIELEGTRHLPPDDLRGPLGLGLGRLEQQLVVDLQHEPGLQPGVAQLVAAGDHRHLDDVGRG